VWLHAAADSGHAMGRWLTPLSAWAETAYWLYAVIFLLTNIAALVTPGPRFLCLLGIVLTALSGCAYGAQCRVPAQPNASTNQRLT